MTTAAHADQKSFYDGIGQFQPDRANLLRQTVVWNADESWWTYMEPHGESAAGTLAKGATDLSVHMGWRSPAGKVSVVVALRASLTEMQAAARCSTT